jgi:glycerol-3-phosphate dehydrogenase
MFHPQWRDQTLSSLRQTFDVIVLGAGITGCGVALDCAQRGLSTLLVERGDIASGTSSRSSKLIHGGLRYLKQMQVRITRQACQERDRLLTLNPHLIRPIRFVYPAYLGDETPAWQIDLGLWMYDQLTGRPDKHTQLELPELETVAPGLVTERLDRALAFNDAFADDARLTLAVAATAHAFGASILPRCEVLGALSEPGGRVNGVVVLDHESGSSYRLSTRVVVNATGVWTDQLRERLGLKGRHLRPSRGAHVILPPGLVELQAAVTVLSPDDQRPVFLIPHPEGTLLGTTDLYHEHDLDDVRPTDQEVDYLLKAAATAFPGKGIERSQLRGAFAGLRPILDTHADEPSEASREEDIWEESGVISVAGGKLTTWRSTAEETVDTVLEHLSEERARHAARCHTKGTALVGVAAGDLAARLQEAHQLLPQVAAGMARRLGSLAWHSVPLARTPAELGPLIDGFDLTAAEVRAHLRWAAVLHLDDLIIRRTRLGMWQPEAVDQLLPILQPVVTEELGWDSRRWDKDLEVFHKAQEGWTLQGVRGD